MVMDEPSTATEDGAAEEAADSSPEDTADSTAGSGGVRHIRRSARLNFRATAAEALQIHRAAATLEQSTNDFLVESATARAQQVLADRRWFMLGDDSWEQFMGLLDAPVGDMPRIRALLASDSVFEH